MGDDGLRERRGPGRREVDKKNAAAARLHFDPRQNPYRDVMGLIGLVLIVIAIMVAHDAVKTAGRADGRAAVAIARVQAGRATAISLTCAALGAVAAAGEKVIGGSARARETPFDRALERIGYPPRGRRIAQATLAARLYVDEISLAVRSALVVEGVRPPKGLVRSDGTLDCQLMLRLADAPTRSATKR